MATLVIVLKQDREERKDLSRLRVRVMVPAPLCGVMIGKGGAFIKSVRERVNADILINAKDDVVEGIDERIVLVTGTCSEVCFVVREILRLMADNPGISYTISSASYPPHLVKDYEKPHPALPQPSVLLTPVPTSGSMMHPEGGALLPSSHQSRGGGMSVSTSAPLSASEIPPGYHHSGLRGGDSILNSGDSRGRHSSHSGPSSGPQHAHFVDSNTEIPAPSHQSPMTSTTVTCVQAMVPKVLVERKFSQEYIRDLQAHYNVLIRFDGDPERASSSDV